MQNILPRLVLLFCLLASGIGLNAQLIITDPAAPTDEQAVTVTFDASQGTAGLADCGCDIYLHTGVITNNSTGPSNWQYVQTTWGVANDNWKLTPVAGEANKYTYTFGPSIREYFSVPTGEEIQQIAFVFRNADGTIEGKAAGGADIFVNVSAGGGILSLTVAGDPGTATYPLGRPLPILVGTTIESSIEVFDNDVLVLSQTGVELSDNIIFTAAGPHTVRVVATTNDQMVTDAFSLDARLSALYTEPTTNVVPANPGDMITLAGTSYISSTLAISDGTNEVFNSTGADFTTTVTLPSAPITTYTLTSTLDGETAIDFVTFITGPAEMADPPMDVRPGATDMINGDVLLQLRAPGKQDVFVLGNHNGFAPTADGRMKRSVDGETFWVTIPASQLDGDLIYEYLIDGSIRQPDPYATLILDPNSDRFIDESTFAGVPTYPTSLATGILTWHRRAVAPYEWQNDVDYDRPDPEKMVVYELLVRDFLEDHSFKSLTDTLDYLERLGVNAIELMPVSEFENNDSWGYNVSFHMALDKYYGSPEDLKAFVDACHQRGLAVILDAVYNHAFGQSPLARMWWDADNFRPTADNPYLNVTARHPFNVGYDMNHESLLTKEYFKETTKYWLEEFRIDGFRFDLTKGFTQRDTEGDVAAWGRYDASRVAILKDYADHIWSVDPEAYMIMEHLSEAREENELAEYGNGMYFWSGFQPHDSYLQASMGYSDDNFRQIIAANRGFSGPNLIGYMESHDEERMQFKNEAFGNGSGSYDITRESIGLKRVKLVSTFFYTVPGPKMLWQFGELGYDFSINYCANGTINENCRTDAKPIRWNYRFNDDRAEVYNHMADLMYLRNNFDILHGEVIASDFASTVKTLEVRGDDGTAYAIGNFGVEARTANLNIAAGTWFDYFTGEQITLLDNNTPVTLAPGEYRLYLDREIESMAGQLPVSLNEAELARLDFAVSPNPTAGELNLSFTLERATTVTIDLLDATGRNIKRFFSGGLGSGMQGMRFEAGNIPAGLYFLRVNDGVGTGVQTVVVR
jgi:1,4-alpha-glucan branching enzyme